MKLWKLEKIIDFCEITWSEKQSVLRINKLKANVNGDRAANCWRCLLIKEKCWLAWRKVISRQSFGFDKESNHFVDRHYIPLNNLPYIERYGQLIFIFSFRKMGEIWFFFSIITSKLCIHDFKTMFSMDNFYFFKTDLAIKLVIILDTKLSRYSLLVLSSQDWSPKT